MYVIFFSKTVPANLPVNITSLICCGGEITITNSSRRPWRKHNHGKRAWLKGRAKDEGNHGIDSCRKCVWVRVCVCVCACASHQCKLLVEDHLLQQWGLVVEEVRLHVAPHVGEPPELIHILQQQIVSFILLYSACKHTHPHTHIHKGKRRETRWINAHRMQIESRWKKVLPYTTSLRCKVRVYHQATGLFLSCAAK